MIGRVAQSVLRPGRLWHSGLYPLAAVVAIFLAGASAPAYSQTPVPTAVILPNGFTQFLDMNGKPLAGGSVAFFQPGTTTPKDTWQDPYQTIVNPAVITLNASGEALIWGVGIYRQVVTDVAGNQIWDQLTGGYNCTGGGSTPGGAPGALQYNNNGILGGLALGNSSQVLYGNASGPPTWGPPPAASVGTISGLGAGVAAALAQPLDGSGPLVAENGATLNNPTLNNPTLNGAVTFTGATAATMGSLILTQPTPNGPSGSIGYGNSTSGPSFCGGYPYFANTGCFIVSINGIPAYIPYWN